MFRGIPPNGKLLSLISNTIQDDLLMGKSYFLELENLVWAVSDLRQAEKYTNRGQLHLWVCLITKQLKRGGWANSRQRVTLTFTTNSTLTPNEIGHYCINMTPINGKKEKMKNGRKQEVDVVVVRLLACVCLLLLRRRSYHGLVTTHQRSNVV